MRAFLHLLRVQQWAKNLLVFVPVVLAHRFQPLVLGEALLAFLAFSLCASAGYILNDLQDREADRRHPQKRYRPLASGRMPVRLAQLLAAALVVIALAGSWLLIGRAFLGLLGVYLLLTTTYSLWLKRQVMADVLVLAGLYALRLLAGGVATETLVSEWLLAFSLFLFASLALVKRYAELRRLAGEGEERVAGRGYHTSDLELIEMMGVASGYISVLVLALYISSDRVLLLYSVPQLLWPSCLLLMYWISRLWILARRGELLEDPVVFALTDTTSWLVGLVGAALLTAAKLVPPSL